MDAVAWKIRELVAESCALVQAVDDGTDDTVVAVELEHLRVRLLALADSAEECEAADAACGVVSDIDAALSRFDRGTARRGAA